MNATLFRDFLFILVLLLVFLVNAPTPPSEDDKAPGVMTVAIHWPEGDQDVDLWVYGPGEDGPIWYKNPSGRIWNLVRDDLGRIDDPFPLNFENAYGRGLLAGQYIVNIHCFRCSKPQKVTIQIKIRRGDNTTDVIGVYEIELTKDKEERTVLQFELDRDGKLVPGSKSQVFKSLISFRRP